MQEKLLSVGVSVAGRGQVVPPCTVPAAQAGQNCINAALEAIGSTSEANLKGLDLVHVDDGRSQLAPDLCRST